MREGAELSTDVSAMYGALTEHLDGMKTVKSCGAQERNMTRFSTLNKRVVRDAMGHVRNVNNTQFLFNVGSVLVLAGALVLMINYLYLPGAVVLVLLYLFFQIIPQFNSIQMRYQGFVNMLPSFVNVTTSRPDARPKQSARSIDRRTSPCVTVSNSGTRLSRMPRTGSRPSRTSISVSMRDG